MLGLVNTCAGVATLVGSAIVTLIPAPRNRVRTIWLALMISMSTENFLLAFGRTQLMWCVGSVLGWVAIPLMNANLDVIFRSTIPPEMQGRVYSCRNTMQFFTIPVGYLVGGALVDGVFEPMMSAAPDFARRVFGSGKGSGAAAMFFVLGLAGVAVCVAFFHVLRPYMREQK